MNISPEQKIAFEKENGMSIESAISHIEKWIDEGNFDSAEAGIGEIKKFAEDAPEAIALEAKIRAKKSEGVEEIVEKKEEVTEATSNIEDVTKQEKFLSAIGYFGYLGVLPLVLKKDSEFCQYHGKQAVVLSIIFTFFGVVGIFLPGGLGLVGVIHLAISVFGFIQANGGKLWNLPVFGDMARKMPF